MNRIALHKNIILIIALGFTLTSCSGNLIIAPTPTVIEPTPTPIPLKEITICTAQEPETLFYYSAADSTAQIIMNAIYDGPFDKVDYLPVPIIMEQVPSLEDGSVAFQPVGVNAGDLIVDAKGNVTTLAQGVQLFPRDCHALDCAIIWDGVSQIQMDALTMTFTIKEGVRWSDGEKVKASDSVYSYELASQLAPASMKTILAKTSTYQALDEQTLQLVTLPGLVASQYETFFFSPLPQHIWGSFTPQELSTQDIASRTPVGWGAFNITSWLSGEKIVLDKNVNYFRLSEGYPAIDRITIKFLNEGESVQSLIETAGCDVVDDSLITASQYAEIEAMKNDPDYQLHIIPGSDWEVLAFGIQPSSYDDGYYPYGSDRPDILGNAEVRSALRQCIDVDTINSQSGLSEISTPFAYFPFAVEDISDSYTHNYDPLAGTAALDAAGWKDKDGNTATPRQAYSVANVPDGTELVLNLFTSQNSQSIHNAHIIQTSLQTCGVQVNVVSLPVTELYASGEDGILFGRNFDLALLSWNAGDTLPCQLFESEEIPTEENFWIGTDDGGGNITGYQNAAYDLYCRQARFGSTGAEQALQNHIEAGKILDQDVPVIGLSFNAKIFVSTGTLRLPDVYASEKYPYSSIEFWEFCDTCN